MAGLVFWIDSEWKEYVSVLAQFDSAKMPHFDSRAIERDGWSTVAIQYFDVPLQSWRNYMDHGFTAVSDPGYSYSHCVSFECDAI
ncbi:MAG TPA: hypothetical protein V6C97_14375 [Oculatellaceae cyanobacterium]